MPSALELAALRNGIAEFNAWRFYDCHETLEDVWLDSGGKSDSTDETNFYHGLIKLAAGFHHLLRGNHHGATTLLTDALRLLDPYRPTTLGVDTERLIADVRPCLDRILALDPTHLAQFDRSTIPTISYDPGLPSQDLPSRSS